MTVRGWHAAVLSAAAVVVAGCGSVQNAAVTPTSSSPPSASETSTPTPSSSTPPAVRVPDADSIARILLAIPVRERPVFLDPYGAAIHGSRLGLGPSLRIAGYRADPLFVCIQHVDMKAGRAGAWTAYITTAHGVTSSGASGGQCPPAPGRPQVRE